MNTWVTACALLLAGVSGFEVCIGCLALEGAVEFKDVGIESTAAFVFAFISLCEAFLNGIMAICLVTACNEMIMWRTKIIIIKVWSLIMIGSMCITLYYGVSAYKSSQGYVYVIVKVAIIWAALITVLRFYCVVKDKISQFHIKPSVVESSVKESQV